MLFTQTMAVCSDNHTKHETDLVVKMNLKGKAGAL